jgi:hypothetical protein
MTLICRGCGVRIQSIDQTKPGYVPPDLVSRENLICQRCFKISHYNQLFPVSLDEEHFLEALKKIGQKKALVVKIMDLFDFNGSFLPSLPRLVNFNPILLAVNKIDLFPRVSWGRIGDWIQRRVKEWGLNPVDMVLLSGSTGNGIDSLLEAINKHGRGRDVYLVGAANVGKSTIINQVVSHLNKETPLRLTTSRFPGTTLEMIDIPLPNGIVLHDTPGIINRKQMTHYVSAEDLKIILPNKKLKPKIYQLNPQQTLFFGGLARLDFISGERQSFVCYMAERLPVHRSKLENADRLYKHHLGGLLKPPGKETLKHWGPLVKHSFHLEQSSDIVFSGLGWVAVKGEKAVLAAYTHPGVSVEKRPVLI